MQNKKILKVFFLAPLYISVVLQDKSQTIKCNLAILHFIIVSSPGCETEDSLTAKSNLAFAFRHQKLFHRQLRDYYYHVTTENNYSWPVSSKAIPRILCKFAVMINLQPHLRYQGDTQVSFVPCCLASCAFVTKLMSATVTLSFS